MSADTDTTRDKRPMVDPATTAYIHILRGCGLSFRSIAEQVGVHENTANKLVTRTRTRIESGEDPADVWESVIRPLVENDPDTEIRASEGDTA